jgi:methionyl-tRNA synthetase
MSKTLGNVVDPIEMAERYGVDAVRYFLMREMSFGSDGDITEDAMVRRYNSDLANDFGNMISRLTAMISRYCNGGIPAAGDLNAEDRALLKEFHEARASLPGNLETMRLNDVIESIMSGVRSINRYIDKQAPWELARQKDPSRLNTVLNTSACAAAAAAGLLWPVMPKKTDEALRCLGVDGSRLTPAVRWTGECVCVGAQVDQNASLFPRKDLKEIEKEKAEAAKSQAKAKKMTEKKPDSAEGGKAEITFDDFAKLDLRVATVLSAEKHPDADRLLVLKLDLGDEQRQVVAGIAEHFEPETLPGRQVVVVANLAPRKLRGVESQGMVLAAHDERGLRLVSPSDETKPGSTVS